MSMDFEREYTPDYDVQDTIYILNEHGRVARHDEPLCCKRAKLCCDGNIYLSVQRLIGGQTMDFEREARGD